MRYEANPKHKEPWQAGQKGSLCPAWSHGLASDLLHSSIPYGRKRFATHDKKAFAAQEHAPDCWHGYPVGWEEVPEPVRRQWLNAGVISNRDVKRYWKAHQESCRD